MVYHGLPIRQTFFVPASILQNMLSVKMVTVGGHGFTSIVSHAHSHAPGLLLLSSVSCLYVPTTYLTYLNIVVDMMSKLTMTIRPQVLNWLIKLRLRISQLHSYLHGHTRVLAL